MLTPFIAGGNKEIYLFVRSKAVVTLFLMLFIVYCWSHCVFCVWSLFCCEVLSDDSSFEITTLGKTELLVASF